jgi:glucose-6-phosphate-specific signal transduction histidine kinase
LLEIWSLPLPEFLAQTHSSTGWGWLQYLENGDTLALLGIALLGGVTLAGYLLLFVRFLGERKWRQWSMVVVEITLVVLVAANWIGAGH